MFSVLPVLFAFRPPTAAFPTGLGQPGEANGRHGVRVGSQGLPPPLPAASQVAAFLLSGSLLPLAKPLCSTSLLCPCPSRTGGSFVQVLNSRLLHSSVWLLSRSVTCTTHSLHSVTGRNAQRGIYLLGWTLIAIWAPTARFSATGHISKPTWGCGDRPPGSPRLHLEGCSQPLVSRPCLSPCSSASRAVLPPQLHLPSPPL